MGSFFRNALTHLAGDDPAPIFQGRVTGVNLVDYTVDVTSLFDRRRLPHVQVMSPYLHHNSGEGISVMPDVGAKCICCIPSDSGSPFILGFVGAQEVVDVSSDDAPNGTTSQSTTPQHPTSATFAAGRPRAKSGDIALRGRDGNYVILHRGGVLQIGAGPIAQTLYIPLRGLIAHLSQNFEQTTAAGTTHWGLQEGVSSQIGAEYIQNFRVFANTEHADIRVSAGYLRAGLGEPDDADGSQELIDQQGLNDDATNPLIYEVAVSPNGFSGMKGDPTKDARNASVIRFFFDRKGGAFLRASGSIVVRTKKKFVLVADKGISMTTPEQIEMSAGKGMVIDGGSNLHLKGGVIKLGSGGKPIMRQGDLMQVILPFTPMPAAAVPLTLFGIGLTGSTEVYG